VQLSEHKSEFLKGIRVREGSLKIFKRSDGKFVVKITRYLWRFKLYNRNIVVNSYEEAEDYFISAKFEKQLPGSVIGIK
jgi:hypothetical protein